MAPRTTTRPSGGLVLVRVVMGALLLAKGWVWTRGGLPRAGDLRDMVRARIPDVWEPMQSLGELFADHPGVFAFVWRWGALLLGLALLVGAFTRPAGILAAIALLVAWPFVPEHASELFLVCAVCCLACGVSRAGRKAGLDRMFDSNFPSWMTWTRSRSSAPF